jgi:hypothetical protein
VYTYITLRIATNPRRDRDNFDVARDGAEHPY